MLRLFALQSIYIWRIINICLIYFISRYTCWGSFAAIVLWSTWNTSFYYSGLSVIITKLAFYDKFWINSLVIFPNTIFCCRHLKLLPFQKLWSSRPSKYWKTPTQSKHWKTEIYQGLVSFDEGGIYFYINRLSSEILRQYITVTNQC